MAEIFELVNSLKRRGRPPGSLTGRNHINLSDFESKIVLLKAAGMSMPAIAVQLETYTENVSNILERPHVARHLLRVTAQMATEIAPMARQLTEELEAVSGEAFDRLTDNMRILDDIGDKALNEGDLKNGIRAKLGCVTTAQDILDRAGKRAPTKTIGAMVHAVAPEQLERLERILGEAK